MKAPRRFSWDAAKNERNIAQRGLSFEAAREFRFGSSIIAVDDRRGYGEVREVAIGVVEERLHVLVLTMRGGTCHVISLRKANKREIRHYVEQTQGMG